MGENVVKKKTEAVLCHESQFTDKEKITDWIFTEAHFNGITSGVDYAEVFDLVNENFTNSSEMLID